MKLRSLHIEDYKVFKNFNIDFLDSDDKPLNIVVLAGVNGSGKTTLFEYIVKYFENEKDKALRKVNYQEGLGGSLIFLKDSIETTDRKDNEPYSSQEILFNRTRIDKVVYIPVGQDNILDLKEAILEHYRRLSRQHSHLEALKEIQNFLDTVFSEDMKITFTIDDIDIVVRDKEKVIFKNTGGDTFNIDKLSTGEKTLLSKVLYLYFKDYRDKVILIDEPELSLHPIWQNKVLKIYENFAEDNNCQIIIATHSPHIIASTDNKYIRFLEKDKKGNISVINDIQAYGRDMEWVLQQMGVKNLRVSAVLEKFTNCQKFLNDEKFDEAEVCINELEEEIGKDDKQIMNLRNSLFFERD